jgi:hypothetical protein
MALHIIDHKRVEMTDGEYSMYDKICLSYDEPKANRKGSDLFVNHFDVNGDGIIIMVKPPTNRYTSLEVFCFLLSIMQNQHLRIIQQQNEMMIEEASTKINELIGQVNALKTKVDESLTK